MLNANQQTRKAIITFLLITFSLSTCFYIMIIHSGKLGNVFGIYVTGIMWCPGLAALITCKLLKRKVSDLAWQWGKSKYQIQSYFIPFLYTVITYLIIWLTGLGRFFDTGFVHEISATYGWEKLPDGAIILIYIVLMGFYGMAGSASAALGEEIGWRGFFGTGIF